MMFICNNILLISQFAFQLYATIHTHTHTQKLKYQENATILKHSFPETPKEGEMRTNNDKTNATFESTDAQTENNCNRETTFERVSRKTTGFAFQLYAKITQKDGILVFSLSLFPGSLKHK